MNAITQLSGTTPGPPAMPTPLAGVAKGESSFKNLLMDSIQQVNTMQVKADNAVEAMFNGSDIHPAEVLTTVQKADLAFRLTMQMRDKLMDVYREIQEIRI